MGNIFAVVGRLSARPLRPARGERADFALEVAAVTGGARARKRGPAAGVDVEVPPPPPPQPSSPRVKRGESRLRRAAAAAWNWADTKGAWWGFLTTVVVAASCALAGFSVPAAEPTWVKVLVAAVGAGVGYAALLAVLTLIFLVRVGPKPATA